MKERSHSVIFLSTTIIFFVFFAFDLEISYQSQINFLITAVIVAGLPHGALDPLVARNIGIIRKKLDWLRFSVIYLAQALAAFFIWVWQPEIALVTFLLLSVWHFSEDWENNLPRFGRALGGISIIIFPAYFHMPEVNQIFSWLGLAINDSVYVRLLTYLGPPFILIYLLFCVLNIKHHPWGCLELICIFIVAMIASPLMFFVIYFCILHSPRHFVKTINSLHIALPTVLLVAFIFSGAAIALVLFIVIITGEELVTKILTQAIFIGLFSLTVPHMILVRKSIKQA